MNSRPGNVGEGEVRIFRNGLFEGIVGAVPGRQHAVDAVAVKFRGAARRGRQRQIIPVPVHFPLL
jgi:hypothetical protein